MSLNEQAAFLRARRTCKATSTLPAPARPSFLRSAAQHNTTQSSVGPLEPVQVLTRTVQAAPTTKHAMNPFIRVPHPKVEASLTDCTHTNTQTRADHSIPQLRLEFHRCRQEKQAERVRYLQNGSVFSARLLAAEHLLQFIHRRGGSLRNRLDVVEERIGTLPGAKGRKFTGFLKWLRMDIACHVTRGAVR